MRAVRRNNFNTTNSVDGHIGGKHIANHFKQKIKTLFNSVGTSDNKLSKLHCRHLSTTRCPLNVTLYPMLMITIFHIAILYQNMMLEKLLVT